MHLHSRLSDGLNSPRTVLKFAAKRGYGVAITDHNAAAGSVEAVRLAKHYGVLCIPGIELNSYDGPHLLAYFYTIDELKEFWTRHIARARLKNPCGRLRLPALKLLELSEDYNALVSLAHPFGMWWVNVGRCVHNDRSKLELLKRVDAIEILAGSLLRKMNLASLRLHKLMVKHRREGFTTAITAGSDGHTVIAHGSCVTCTKAEHAVDSDSFLKAVTKSRVFALGKEPFTELLLENAVMLRRHLRYAPNWLRESYRRLYPHGLGLRQRVRARML